MVWPTELSYDFVMMGPDGITYWKTGELDSPIYQTPGDVPIIRRVDDEEEVIVISDDEEEVIVISDDEEEAEEAEENSRPPRRLAAIKCDVLNWALFKALDLYGEEF